jgi:peptidoglycan hydrolase-like protein with peptidoglycan-binding domain
MNLRLGSRGIDVHRLQALLIRHGFILVVDGIFGPITDAAVRSFQKTKGLAVDGIVGAKTWAALELSSGADKPILRSKFPRMKGEAVKEFQWLVTKQGFDCGAIDGVYGAKAVGACKAFQKAKGLAPDGTVGAKTWSALKGVTWVHRLLEWGFESLIEIKGLDAATKQFQVAMGLVPDGVVGAKTFNALQEQIIVPRVSEHDMKCQCNKYCNGYPVGQVGIGVRLLAERIFREAEKAYPGAEFYLTNRAHPTPNGSIAGGTRCSRWNKERGGANGSQHKSGMALDIWGRKNGVADSVIRNRLENIALELNKYGGVGYGARYIVHIDTRGKRARWKY